MDDTPQPLENIDFKNVIRDAKNYIEELAKEDGYNHESCDCEHFMYETVMKTVYGNNIFKWINKKLQ